jgi:hypothetical protein
MAMSLPARAGILALLTSFTRTGPGTPPRPRRRARRAVRAVCAGCARQRALFRSHGLVCWGRYHTLCRRHYRLLRQAC